MKNFLYLTIITFLCVSIESQPVQFQWLQTVNGGSGYGSQNVDKIVTDLYGNIYTTGAISQPTSGRLYVRKTTPTGAVNWTYIYPNKSWGRDVIIDTLGNVYATGVDIVGSEEEIVVVKLNNSGQMQWIYKTNCSVLGGSQGVKLALSSNQNSIFVTGKYSVPDNSTDIAIISINTSTGAERWLRSYTNYRDDTPIDMKVMRFNAVKDYVYVTGILNMSSDQDMVSFVIEATDIASAIIGFAEYNSGGQNNDSPCGIIPTTENFSFYVAGVSSVYSSNLRNIKLFKYNWMGDTLWTRTYPYTNLFPFQYFPEGLFEMDKDNNLIIGGTKDSSGGSIRDLRIIKYNSSGTLLWSSTFERPADYDQCTGICVDDSNNIYANVETYLPAYQKNIGIYKYDKNGNLRWNQYYTGLNNSTISSSITVDKYFNVYAGGWGSPTIGVLLKYSQGYNSITSYQHTNLNLPIPDPGNVSDTIYVSNDNPLLTLTDVNVTIDTVIHSNVSDLEFYLIHDGITDTLIYQVGGSGDNFIRTTLNDSASTSIAVGTAPFTGSFKPSKPLNIFNSGNHSGAWILNVYDRLSGNTGTLKAWSIQLVFLSPTGINTVNGNVPDQFSLSQNYPNPFNPATKIRFSIPNVASSLSLNNVTLKVYDLLGREVLTLVNEQLKPGTYEVDFDGSRFSSGVYFYKLATDAFVQTKKMILVK